MKTVLKRLLSFVLVAMMLVSVMPFQASADETFTVNALIGEHDGVYDNVGSHSAAGGSYAQIVDAAKAALGDRVNSVDSPYQIDCYDASGNLTAVLLTAGDTVPDGSVVFNVWYRLKDWTYTITDGSKTLKSGDLGSTNESALNTDVAAEEFVGNTLGTQKDFYTYKSKSVNSSNRTVVFTVEPKDCTISFDIKLDGKSGLTVSPVNKKYGETYTFDAFALSGKDSKLFNAGQWVIKQNDVTIDTVSDKSSWTVVGNVTASIDLSSNGWKTSKLWAKNSAGEWVSEGTLYWKSGEKIEGWKAAPSVGTTTGFTRWNSQQDGRGVNLPAGNLGATEILLDNYYAQYETNYNNGNAEVRVTAVYFVDGIEHHRSSQYVLTLEEVPAGTNVMTAEWLNSAGNKQAIERGIADNARNIDSYTWDGGFYNSSFSTSYASTGLKANGNTNVYVKVVADKAEVEDVYLYIHKNTTSKDPAQIVSMKGYVGDDYVTLADAKEVAKKNDWRADSYKIYSDNDWKQLVAGGNPDGNGEEVRVNEGTNTIVHILLKNGYKTSGTADNSNYKTGDTIMIAVTALGLSASALVVLYLVNKKKRAL